MPHRKRLYNDAEKTETGSSEGIRYITSDNDLSKQMKNIEPDHLLVVYFSLPWCGSCQKMNPSVDALFNKYSEATFLKVNSDRCPISTKKYHINKVPVFLLFINRVKVDTVVGASPSELESKIRRNLGELHYQTQGFISPPQVVTNTPTHLPKMADVAPYLDRSQCRCVNDLSPSPFEAFLDGKRLVSGNGIGRMILFYVFKESMVITGIKIKAPVFSAPKIMRFFVNLHKILDFSAISQLSSTQEINLGEDVLKGDHVVELNSGGLVGVQNVQIFIPESMTKNRKIEIDSLTLIGAPISYTPYVNTEISTANEESNASFDNNDDDDYEVPYNANHYAAAAAPSFASHRSGPSGPSPSMIRKDHYSYQ